MDSVWRLAVLVPAAIAFFATGKFVYGATALLVTAVAVNLYQMATGKASGRQHRWLGMTTAAVWLSSGYFVSNQSDVDAALFTSSALGAAAVVCLLEFLIVSGSFYKKN